MRIEHEGLTLETRESAAVPHHRWFASVKAGAVYCTIGSAVRRRTEEEAMHGAIWDAERKLSELEDLARARMAEEVPPE